MDTLSLVYKHLIDWVIAPVTQQFLGIFNLNGRLGLLFLCVSYGVAYGLFRFRKRRGLSDAHSFWHFIGGSRVHLHRSALLDYRYYFVRAILKVALVLPIVHLVDPYILRSGDYLAFSATSGASARAWGRTSGCRCSTGWGCSCSRTSSITGRTGPFTRAGCGNSTRSITRRRCWSRRRRAGCTSWKRSSRN